MHVAPLAWLAIALGSFAWTALRHVQFARQVRRGAVCTDEAICNLWRRVCRQAGVRATIPIRICHQVDQPAILGCWSPELLLPPDAAELPEPQLQMIMLHELAHVRRADVAQNWLLVALRSLYWWNPVYWFAAARYQALREQACDAWVVRRLAPQQHRGYCELLIDRAQRAAGPRGWQVMLPAGLLWFVPGLSRQRALRGRLMALRRGNRQYGRWQVAAVVGLMLTAIAVGLTDAARPSAAEAVDRYRWLPPAAAERGHARQAAVASDTGPPEERTYDVAAALARIARDFASADEAQSALTAHLAVLFDPQRYDAALLDCRELSGLDASNASSAAATPVPADAPASSSVPHFTLDGAVLTVIAPARVHAELAMHLAAWEQSGLGQIAIRTRFISSRSDLAAPLGIGWQYVEAFATRADDAQLAGPAGQQPAVRVASAVHDYLPVAVSTIDSQRAAALVDAARADRSSHVLQAATITLFNAQQASIVDGSQTAFVVGLRETPDGRREPRTVMVDEGLRISIRAVLSADRRLIQLEGQIEMSSVGEVRQVATGTADAPLALEIPRVLRWSIDLAGCVEDGATLLVGAIPLYEEQRFLYVLLSPQQVFPAPSHVPPAG